MRNKKIDRMTNEEIIAKKQMLETSGQAGSMYYAQLVLILKSREAKAC